MRSLFGRTIACWYLAPTPTEKMVAKAKKEVYVAKSSSLNILVRRGVAKKGNTWASPVPSTKEETFLENSEFRNLPQMFFSRNIIYSFFEYSFITLPFDGAHLQGLLVVDYEYRVQFGWLFLPHRVRNLFLLKCLYKPTYVNR